jgi:hypothetical protein
MLITDIADDDADVMARKFGGVPVASQNNFLKWP